MLRNDRKNNIVGNAIKQRGGAKISLVNCFLACFLMKVLDFSHVILVFVAMGWLYAGCGGTWGVDCD